jgi:AmmeMemoRadiSam system protein B
MIATRPPAVAGMFYPGDPPTLTATVDALLGRSEQYNRPAAQGTDRPACRLHLFRLDGRRGLCLAGAVAAPSAA